MLVQCDNQFQVIVLLGKMECDVLGTEVRLEMGGWCDVAQYSKKL